MPCRISCKKRRNGLFKSFKILPVQAGTIDRYVKNTSCSPEKLVNVHLPNEHVNKLVKNCIATDQRYYGLRRRAIWPFGWKYPFNQEKSAAGKKWLRSFLKRHPVLSMRKPEGIISARVKGCVSENSAKFFDVYEPELKKKKI